jgi:hypothetical protein
MLNRQLNRVPPCLLGPPTTPNTSPNGDTALGSTPCPFSVVRSMTLRLLLPLRFILQPRQSAPIAIMTSQHPLESDGELNSLVRVGDPILYPPLDAPNLI